MGHDPNLKWKVLALMAVQFLLMYIIKDSSWVTVFLCAYFFGGVINHSLILSIHEIAHNFAFGHASPMKNRIFGIIANLPLAVPLSISFKKYHLMHHRYQGDEKLDTDIPCELEARLFRKTGTKVLWVLLQPFFYLLRPLLIHPTAVTKLEIVNAFVQFAFNYLVIRYAGWHMVAYLFGGLCLAMGLHPVAGHFISEHYMFKKGYETYSYYGPLNWITFNVGYHNEHHDFPSIPGSKLPEVKRIAKEYYDDLPHHSSWSRVIYDFIMDPSIGPTARIKRKHITAGAIQKNNSHDTKSTEDANGKEIPHGHHE